MPNRSRPCASRNSVGPKPTVSVSCGRRQAERLAGVVRRRLGHAADRADRAGVLARRSSGPPRRSTPAAARPARSRSSVMTSNATKCSRSWAGVTMPGLVLAVERAPPRRRPRAPASSVAPRPRSDRAGRRRPRRPRPTPAPASATHLPPRHRAARTLGCSRLLRDDGGDLADRLGQRVDRVGELLQLGLGQLRCAASSRRPSRCLPSAAVHRGELRRRACLTSAGVALLAAPGAAPRRPPWNPPRWRRSPTGRCASSGPPRR